MTKNIPQMDDTIAAIATAIGPGGIGIVRISGPLAIKIACKIFISSRGKKSVRLQSHRVYHGHICNSDTNDVIDEVLITIMRGPKSYTCEDVVEISSHGGLMAVKAILELVIALGARLAQPGEFTRRAFLNGRLDLVQAEAVLDIIQAKTQSSLRVSTHQLKGELTLQLEKIRTDLLEAYIRLEALVNFPEDGIEDRGRNEVSSRLLDAKMKINTLLAESNQGRLLREGAKLVLCGRPNVGKSSLLNVLLKQPRAIVSEVAGTTRDTIEESAQINGIPFQIVDTAGILEPRDIIEEEAVKRSRLHMQSADLVLLTFSASERIVKDDMKIMKFLEGQNILVVINKSDLPSILLDQDIKAFLPQHKIVRVSAATRAGINELESAIEQNILKGRTVDTTQILLTNTRHIEALKNAVEFIIESEQFLQNNLSLEFISENLKDALAALDRITGRDVDADLLDNIFSTFCIGK
ncbi:MAG: tRNA uridine-5-carboxymethylaminomethyl(34) synthesis GTPase MnmE [Candidatus Omnitrophica bacterium]|nr:tRNA uridine-5-carboxymethylaminomethyl(34) synthesis GTPase MnmE [Candidatus Omnitrophota bacterium]